MKTEKEGFILVTVFVLLAVGVMLVTQLYRTSTYYNAFIPVACDRERAKVLARSGIQLALNQLSLHDSVLVLPDKKDEKAGAPKKDKDDPELRARGLLNVLLSVQNKWQTFTLQEKEGQEVGVIKICISCEDGKIPLNTLFDYKTKKLAEKTNPPFKAREFLNELFDKMKPFVKGDNLFEVCAEFLKEQKYELADVSELLEAKGFKEAGFELFYVPEEEKEKKESSAKLLFLSDIFTIWSGKDTVDPLLLSPTLRKIFDLNPEGVTKSLDPEVLKKIVEKIPLPAVSWQKEWDTYLKSVYEKELKNVSKQFISILSSKFEPQTFSVLCYGKAGRVEQKLVAIITRSFTPEGEVFEIKKLYWL